LSKPAARIGDMHMCPKETPGTPPMPHVGGTVFGGCPTVLIEGQPAAREGDSCTCVGEPDIITTGSSGVYIGGQPAARMGDQTAHGGKIVAGSRTVMIGEIGRIQFFKSSDESGDDDFIEPSLDEKFAIINKAIVDCSAMLEKKITLLSCNDHNTLIEFRKWFGCDDQNAKKLILQRMKKILAVVSTLNLKDFDKINIEKDRKTSFAEVYPKYDTYKIFLGDHFWKAGEQGMDCRGGVLVHELSHSKKLGKTFDFVDGQVRSLALAREDPGDALKNADSFEYFVES
jgi:uncharacterized Zn-binding protein involved in type VI secretion